MKRNIKTIGASMLFVNNHNEVLMVLRDDLSDIPFPNCWDLLGGHVERKESPEDCIIRELQEEIEVKVEKPILYKIFEFEDRLEYTFWKKVAFKIKDIHLNEGQRLKWFNINEISSMEESLFAFDFKTVIVQFINDLGKKF